MSAVEALYAEIEAPAAEGFSFVVPGIPTPWARAGGGKSVVRFTPAKQRTAMGALKLICASAMKGAAPFDGPLRLEVIAAYPWPASWSAKKRAAPWARWKTSRPDIDNVCLKIVGDALNGVAWLDDAQIASAHSWKIYDAMPGLRVKVERLS